MNIPRFCPECGEAVSPETTRLCRGTKIDQGLPAAEGILNGREVVTIYCLSCKKVFTIEDISDLVPQPNDLAWD